MCRLCITSLCLLALVPVGGAQSPYTAAGISDARQVEILLAELQRASSNDDRDAVAALIEYPVTIMIDGLRVPFADPKALLERYDAIFTPALQETISRAVGADRAGQGRERVTVSARGVLIGTNTVLIKEVTGRLKIAEIVVPHPDRDPDVGPVTSAATSARVGRSLEPRRVGVLVGTRATRLSGALAAGALDAYIVWVPKGKVLEVRLERVKDRMAVVRVKHSGTGAPLNPKAVDGARVITGLVTDGADYQIEVVRAGSDELGPLPYVLSLTFR